jgi:hypothetical protein
MIPFGNEVDGDSTEQRPRLAEANTHQSIETPLQAASITIQVYDGLRRFRFTGLSSISLRQYRNFREELQIDNSRIERRVDHISIGHRIPTLGQCNTSANDR